MRLFIVRLKIALLSFIIFTMSIPSFSYNIQMNEDTQFHYFAYAQLYLPDYCDDDNLDSIKQAFVERGKKFDSVISNFFNNARISQQEFEQDPEQHMDVFDELTNYLIKNHMDLIRELANIDNYLAEKCYYNFYEVYQMRNAAQWAYQEILGQGIVHSVNKPEGGGGCLIATATFGSELAPQVQQLRELRDVTLLSTNSGTSFVTAFNQMYYSFSPTIADLERENPVFKEAVKLTITPMLSTLSLLNYVDIDSEAEVLGYGIGVIMMNVAMYFVAPVVIIYKLKSKK